MPAKVEDESEILLGNKQLLAVFAVVAVLLAIAFAGGYMLGRSSAEKKPVATDSQTAAGSDSTALTSHTVTPDDTAVKTETTPDPPPPVVKAAAPQPAPMVVRKQEPEPLGAHKPQRDLESTPRPGQTYVQVAALTRPQAEATAEVLRKQHFAARIAPKPGTNIFRVLVGPTKDAGEITNTRDALRKIGFRDVIVQRY